MTPYVSSACMCLSSYEHVPCPPLEANRSSRCRHSSTRKPVTGGAYTLPNSMVQLPEETVHPATPALPDSSKSSSAEAPTGNFPKHPRTGHVEAVRSQQEAETPSRLPNLLPPAGVRSAEKASEHSPLAPPRPTVVSGQASDPQRRVLLCPRSETLRNSEG